MPNSEILCPRCGKPTTEKVTGSITQWIAICKCNALGVPAEPNVDPIQVCLTCGNRIDKGRSGTITQWIFRKEHCVCDVPNPIDRAYGASSSKPSDRGAATALQNTSSQVVESEIEVDTRKFPIDRFAPIALIGTTSESKIYLSIDRILGSKVAIKVMNRRETDSIVQFHKEVKTLASLSHDGIVKVFDFSEINGTPYMVMEYVEGPTLREFLKSNNRVSIDDTLMIVKTLCRTLAYCHSKNVFHRDIKPENILISGTDSESMEIKLIDFGIAWHTDSTLKPGYTVAGTPQYMAPDSGRGKIYDARTEIYSVGCLMYEMLSGSVPFDADSPLQLLRMHAEEEIPSIRARAHIDDFDSRLEDIILKCLAKEPDDRYQSVDYLLSAIEELAAGKVEPQTKLSGHSTATNESSIKGYENRYLKAFKVSLFLVVPLLACFIIFIFNTLDKTSLDDSQNSNPRDISEEARLLRVIEDQAASEGPGYSFRYRTVYLKPLQLVAKLDNRYRLEFFGALFGKADDLLVLKDTHYSEVSASMSNMQDAHLEAFLKMKDLQFLKAGNTYVTLKGIKMISKHKKLETLQLDDVVNDEGLQYLAELPNLRVLELKNCNITDKGLSFLEGCGNLRKLDLRACSAVTAKGVASLKRALPDCKVIQ